MAEEQKQKGTRIYSGGSAAKTTYQGSAQSRGFNAVKAANSDKAMADYREKMTREDPILGRFIRLEEEVADLKLEIQFLKKELKSK